MTKTRELSSVQERIYSIDAIRGFAIFGIFFTNMLDFHSPMLYLDPYAWWESKADQNMYNVIDFFFQASFYPLFALLFGFGLMTIRENAILRGERFNLIAIRRLVMLLIIGCLHAFFIWHGDILINYAIFGLISLYFLRWEGKFLVYFGVFLYLFPNLFFAFLSLSLLPEVGKSNLYDALKSIDIYQTGSFLEIAAQRLYDWNRVNSLENFPLLFFSIFPLLLIGAGIAKQGFIGNKLHNPKKLKVFLGVFLFLGIILKVIPFLFRDIFTEYVQDIFGGPLLAMSYGLIIILILENSHWKLRIFQSVGKLALSNYLFQSIFSTFLFYSYGFGLYNKISVGAGSILVIGIYILQAYGSRVWLRKYHHGPIEWGWRAFTYLSKPRWKK